MRILEPNTIIRRLYDKLEPSSQGRRISDVRMGFSYVGMKLDDGTAGIAAFLQNRIFRSCTVVKEAGTFAGSRAPDILKYLVEGKENLRISIGLALANALVTAAVDPAEDREATTLFNLQPGEKVVMVGLFGPLIQRIRDTGAELTIIEKNPDRLNPLPEKDRKQALKECDVAIITATTLLNHTFEEIIGLLGKPRLTALMGPSTPLVPEVFSDTPITHLGGSVVINADRILQIISEGGGTPALRPYLRFVNLTRKPVNELTFPASDH